MKKVTLLKNVGLGVALSLLAGYASAEGVGDIVGTVDVQSAKPAIIALGVAVGGLIATGIGVRYVLGVMKRI